MRNKIGEQQGHGDERAAGAAKATAGAAPRPRPDGGARLPKHGLY